MKRLAELLRKNWDVAVPTAITLVLMFAVPHLRWLFIGLFVAHALGSIIGYTRGLKRGAEIVHEVQAQFRESSGWN